MTVSAGWNIEAIQPGSSTMVRSPKADEAFTKDQWRIQDLWKGGSYSPVAREARAKILGATPTLW